MSISKLLPVFGVFLIYVEHLCNTLNVLLSPLFRPIIYMSVSPQCSYSGAHHFPSGQVGNTYNVFLSFHDHIINYIYDHKTFLLRNFCWPPLARG